MRHRRLIVVAATVAALAAAWLGLERARREAGDAARRESADAAQAAEPDPPEVAIGERLFLEPRFAQFFFARRAGNVNAPLPGGDPILDRTILPVDTIPGPFAGGATNCRSCHLVDEHASVPRAGSRGYTDFAVRSPVSVREDGATTTPRNSPTLVGAALRRPGMILHFDGEFGSTEDLVVGTLLGRNFGWLPDERAAAVRHLARVIREDDGSDSLARRFGGPYPVVLAATAESIPPQFRLPPEHRLDVARATDERIVDAVARLITAYVESLVFHEGPDGMFDGSPYDVFLKKNGLPRKALSGESDSAYVRRLRDGLERLRRPRFVGSEDGRFRLHDQPFVFGALELRGLRIFLGEPRPEAGRRGGVGNCAVCHPPPSFTDFGVHNTGAAQSEYDAIHGAGAFAGIYVPDVDARNARPEAWLPASAAHPRARGPFRAPASRDRPGETDLGLWNVLGNPYCPGPQASIVRLLCEGRAECPTPVLLDRSIARFKTPGLRDLGHSAPYLHTGRAATIEAVLAHYVEFPALARSGKMRNPDPDIAGVALEDGDLPALAAFLRSLNEDYE